ncbi:MAG: hypothetical protein ACI845_000262, partial [Gammaproteobacteria bacterium]
AVNIPEYTKPHSMPFEPPAFNWKTNDFPLHMLTSGCRCWIHMDVRSYDRKYLADKFFVIDEDQL